MFHKIKSVIVKDNLIIEAIFEDNERRQYDINKIINKWKIFKKLEDRNLFEKVKVDVGGHGISWNENIDLSSEEIWENGVEVK